MTNGYSKGLVAGFLVLASMLSGCSMMAPNYQPDLELVNEMKDFDLAKMKTGGFSGDEAQVTKISLRGSALNSPYNAKYSDYLKVAVAEQLKQANVWDENSTIVISGELLKNSLNGNGISTGEADIGALFVVTKDEQEVYRKEHLIHHEWPSSFVGAIAIPNAVNAYPVAMQKLMRAFLLDPDLIAALK